MIARRSFIGFLSAATVASVTFGWRTAVLCSFTTAGDDKIFRSNRSLP